jgi:DNA-binding NtrC family response regulator
MSESRKEMQSGSHSDQAFILVVEDDEDMRRFVLGALADEGLPCITAATVAEALDTLLRQRVALMVLDWRLDRCAAAVLQQANANYPQMPVIVMSGGPYDVRTDAIVGQADAFLEKPFSATVLRGQVNKLLKRAERLAQALLPATPEDIRPLNEIKEQYIRHVVRLLNDNISLAAERLGIHRQTVGAALRRTDSLDPALASQPG